MNNDDVSDLFDIDPFAQVLVDPAPYDAAFPGLAGSRDFHADANCDGVVDLFDVDPFVVRITNYPQWLLDHPNCEHCVGELAAAAGGVSPLTAAGVAEMLTEYVSPSVLPAFVGYIEAVAAEHPDAQRRAFWEDVLKELD